MLDTLYALWPHITATIMVAIDIWAASHAILYKRDPRSATTWIGVIILFPALGAILYVLFGINRIQRRATQLRTRSRHATHARRENDDAASPRLSGDVKDLETLAGAVQRITGAPLLAGNTLAPLHNGDEAYPAMLDAIARAERSITLCSYIFAHDKSGKRFADALGEAAARGVAVRVLIDDVGARYSLPTIYNTLHRRGVTHASFMPTFFHWRMPYINLRNHRKVMVVDGRLAFTGGLNIRHNNVVSAGARDSTQDLHFRVEGPVVGQLQHIFAEDWDFATRERLTGEPWFVPLHPCGGVLARAVVGGPDANYERLRSTLLAALSCARRRVRIVTPYFLPDQSLISALNTCAMRGVAVEIVIPEKINLRTVGWACQAHLWQVLKSGCRIWRAPAPFDHSKIMTIDDAWSFVGSANWDARSLRLNFELNMECYSAAFAATLNAAIDKKRDRSRETTLAEVNSRSLPVQLRDGIARLFWPFL